MSSAGVVNTSPAMTPPALLLMVAAPAALVVPGLPTDRFAFEGFLPRRAGELETLLQDAGRVGDRTILPRQDRPTVEVQ